MKRPNELTISSDNEWRRLNPPPKKTQKQKCTPPKKKPNK